MADISTFQKYKDWLTATVIGLLFTATSSIIAINRSNIAENEARDNARFAKIEKRLESYEDVKQMGFERLREAETRLKDAEQEIDRLRDEIDRLRDRKD